MTASRGASRTRIDRDWEVLSHEIGIRYAGTAGEQHAADHIELQLRRAGLTGVHQWQFEFPNWDFKRCALHVGHGKPTRRIVTARPMAYSVATPKRGVSGRLAYIQGGHPYDFDQPLRGRIALLMGSLMLGDQKVQDRILASGVKALIAADARMPSDWTTSNGASPAWMNGYDVPTVGISYMDAVRLAELAATGPVQANLTIAAQSFPARSQHVIGEIVGRDRPDQVIIISGHHDSVWGNVGADDNASGVIFTMELARLFGMRGRPHPRRTIRFISFGVEERLSVGSYLYMRSLDTQQRKRIALMINLDVGSAAAGTDVAMVTGTPSLEKLVRSVWAKRRHPIDVQTAVNPYSDHFPFNIVGAPSLWLSRPTLTGGGYWTLHSTHDTTEHLSSAVLARTIDSTAGLLDRIANAPRLPFDRGIEAGVASEVRQVARREYRHPWSLESFDYTRQ